MAGFPIVQAFQALSLVADALPNFNLPTPIYAVLASDTFLPLAIPDNWREFSPTFENALSDAPMETGAFQVFNTVARPTTIRVGMTKSGSDLARYAWLSAILQARANNPTQLYTLLAPEGVFVDYTIAKISYDKQQQKGSNQLYLDLLFQEIPQVPQSLIDGQSIFDNPIDPKSGPVAQVGRVFTNAVSAANTALAQASSLFSY
jgi:hypothetical protein